MVVTPKLITVNT
ncbi:hypothetical protein FWK35_00034025 [Aphis craccivora]|uniref:Uncharacterized protein n=1 Tax=Aphis craccivora TaxID=307492 RepID=A0A6G0Y0G3_APHCR|nr:hypothetical protein FWK35_00034025 [Aphis craccivora]